MEKENNLKDKMFHYGEKIKLNKNSSLYPDLVKKEEVTTDGNFTYVSKNMFHYVSMERGKENKHFETEYLEKILYFIFRDITFKLSENYAVKNRNKANDFRKILFDKQLALLGQINITYKSEYKEEVKRILEKYPYTS